MNTVKPAPVVVNLPAGSQWRTPAGVRQFLEAVGRPPYWIVRGAVVVDALVCGAGCSRRTARADVAHAIQAGTVMRAPGPRGRALMVTGTRTMLAVYERSFRVQPSFLATVKAARRRRRHVSPAAGIEESTDGGPPA